MRREDWESLLPTVYGWGINDVNYNITTNIRVNGLWKVTWECPYYLKWMAMLQRSYCLKCQERQPMYKGCTVDPEWRYLSNFIKWVDSQPNRDWQNCELDKDFLIKGNKHYGKDTVIFIPKNLNLFMTYKRYAKYNRLLGVTPVKGCKADKYVAHCRNPFTKKSEYLGRFTTEIEAHKAWQAKKHEYALRLAERQVDHRVAKVLRERYAPDKDWTNK